MRATNREKGFVLMLVLYFFIHIFLIAYTASRNSNEWIVGLPYTLSFTIVIYTMVITVMILANYMNEIPEKVGCMHTVTIPAILLTYFTLSWSVPILIYAIFW